VQQRAQATGIADASVFGVSDGNVWVGKLMPAYGSRVVAFGATGGGDWKTGAAWPTSDSNGALPRGSGAQRPLRVGIFNKLCRASETKL